MAYHNLCQSQLNLLHKAKDWYVYETLILSRLDWHCGHRLDTLNQMYIYLGQSLRRKAQELLLAVSYQSEQLSRSLFVNYSAHHFSGGYHLSTKPWIHTPVAPPLRKLVDYINDSWLFTTKWPTSNLSVHNNQSGQSVTEGMAKKSTRSVHHS